MDRVGEVEIKNKILVHRLPRDKMRNGNDIMEVIVLDEYCIVYDSLTHYTQRVKLGKLFKYDIYEGIPIYHDQTNCYYKIWFNKRIGYISSSHTNWFGYKEYESYGMIQEILETQKSRIEECNCDVDT